MGLKHRCRVYQLDGSYRIECSTCGFYRGADGWYQAMGEARHHWQEQNMFEGNITLNQLLAALGLS